MKGMQWTVGDVTISQIVEIEAGEVIQKVIRGASTENILKIDWLYPHFTDEEGNLKALVQGFLVQSAGKNILIDTCNGNQKTRVDVPEWGGLQTDFLERLSAFGLSEDHIDIVACTHLHFDHVGWNTRPENSEWVPTFPKAQYYFSKEEYTYWKSKPNIEIVDDKAAFDDSVAPIMKAGLAELVSTDHVIDDNLQFIPTPGHTPAHVAVVIESKGEKAIISGDFLHHPCQIAHPEWATHADTFPDKAVETRKRILKEIADTETKLFGSHFANPVVGRVVRKERGLEFRV